MESVVWFVKQIISSQNFQLALHYKPVKLQSKSYCIVLLLRSALQTFKEAGNLSNNKQPVEQFHAANSSFFTLLALGFSLPLTFTLSAPLLRLPPVCLCLSNNCSSPRIRVRHSADCFGHAILSASSTATSKCKMLAINRKPIVCFCLLLVTEF